jgi:DNA polymerase-3 subunit epsilon
MEQRTLRAAYQFYCAKDIVNAHSAEADTRATMEVLIAQVAKYADVEYEDKKGIKTKPVVNDVEALHKFTNLNKPVDFAGRMVYSDAGEELFNFGKHKGKKVEDVFKAEPSYYAWMMQGDFPLYTKRKLEQVYKRYMAKREQPKTEQKPTPPKPAPEVQPEAKKVTPQLTQLEKKAFSPKPNPAFVPRRDRQEDPAKPIDTDMLKQLADKFKKG